MKIDEWIKDNILLIGSISALTTGVTNFVDIASMKNVSELMKSVFDIITIFSDVSFLISVIYLLYVIKKDIEFSNEKIEELTKQEKTAMEIVNPQNYNEFYSIFHDADAILAYNPPLSLLVRSPNHRNLIYSLLNNNCSYKLIVGHELVGRIKLLKTQWIEEKKDISSLNLQVLYNAHKEDLHSTVKNWNLTHGNTHLRGLSFFIIHKKSGEHIIMLYILGEPFTSEFSVPSKAIVIKKYEGRFEMYSVLEKCFKDCWNRVEDEFERNGLKIPKISDNDWIETCEKIIKKGNKIK